MKEIFVCAQKKMIQIILLGIFILENINCNNLHTPNIPLLSYPRNIMWTVLLKKKCGLLAVQPITLTKRYPEYSYCLKSTIFVPQLSNSTIPWIALGLMYLLAYIK
uniref:Uncharacterized protein n=1 Tax=Arundo donax TaxID=35708 RepID=A0A0A9CQE5_ARUDO